MNYRTPQTLLIITAALACIIAVFMPPWKSSESDRQSQVTFPELERIQSVTIEFPSSDGRAPIWLERRPGNGWTLKSGDGEVSGMRAHSPLVEKFLSYLYEPWRKIPSAPDPETGTGRKVLADMGLFPASVTITMNTATIASGKDVPVIINLGDLLDDNTTAYASSSTMKDVGLAPADFLTMAAQPYYYWKDRFFLGIPANEISHIKVLDPASGSGTTELERDERNDFWTISSPVHEPADHQSIVDRLQRLGQTEVIEFRPPTDKFDTTEVLRMVVTDESGNERELRWDFIKRPEDDPAEEDEPPLYLLKDSGNSELAVMEGYALTDWIGGVDKFRDRRMLLMSPDSINAVDVSFIAEDAESFTLSKDDAGKWTILPKAIGNEKNEVTATPIRANTELMDQLVNLASRMRIKSFPRIPWDSASTVGLQPPRARYQFFTGAGNDSNGEMISQKTLVAELMLGNLDQDSRIIYAAHNRNNSIYTLDPVDALSLPREIYKIRDLILMPDIEDGMEITSIGWSSGLGQISMERSAAGQWNGLGTVEQETLSGFCQILAEYRVDQWRGAGKNSLDSFGIPMDLTEGFHMTLTTQSGDTSVIAFGRRSPRGGYYAATEFSGVPYVFIFPTSLIDRLSPIREIRNFYE